jgi:hypothetical protein
MTPESKMKRLKDLGYEAYKGGLYLKAAKIFHQGAELAKTYHNDQMLVHFLFCEGTSYKMAEQYDNALTPLMEAAANRSPEANPADIYNASTNLIDISLKRKTATYTQNLIQQTRTWLENNHKENWSHLLDLLAGKLAFNRGDFEASYAFQLDAWHVWRGGYPCFTEAYHLSFLCTAAFMNQDIPALQKWVAAIEACVKNLEGDQIDAQECRLLLFRAERSPNNLFSIPADMALSVLDRWELIEGVTGENLIDALRVLVLARRWLDIDRILNKYPLNNSEEGLIFLGDNQLNRARDAFNLPLHDDEYAPHSTIPDSHKGDAQQARKYLSQAMDYYTQGLEYAKEKDIRLETDYWCNTIHQRMKTVKGYEKLCH